MLAALKPFGKWTVRMATESRRMRGILISRVAKPTTREKMPAASVIRAR